MYIYQVYFYSGLKPDSQLHTNKHKKKKYLKILLLPCLRFNVRYVIYIQLQHAQVFHRKTTGKEYQTFCNVNCKTPNVVYLLVCHVSGSQYVGESVQPFNKRMNGHRSDLTKKTLFPVSQHFVSPGLSLDDFVRSKHLYH